MACFTLKCGLQNYHKILAERLKPLLPMKPLLHNIIHPDQKGYVNGRNIFEANRMLKDVIEYSEENKINSSIIFIDYQKVIALNGVGPYTV